MTTRTTAPFVSPTIRNGEAQQEPSANERSPPRGAEGFKRIKERVTYAARCTRSLLMQLVQTFIRLVSPFTLARTRWMFGLKRRLVRTCECETDLPNCGDFPQMSHTEATRSSSIVTKVVHAAVHAGRRLTVLGSPSPRSNLSRLAECGGLPQTQVPTNTCRVAHICAPPQRIAVEGTLHATIVWYRDEGGVCCSSSPVSHDVGRGWQTGTLGTGNFGNRKQNRGVGKVLNR